jgi:hypothetical protein
MSGRGNTEARQQKVRSKMQHRSTFETSRYNNCNIRLKADETLKNTSETLAKTHENYCKAYATSR